MKKTAIRALSLLFAASLLTAGLTGCTQELEGAELTKAYETRRCKTLWRKMFIIGRKQS